MTNTSRGAQETLVMKESRADMTMGPRHTAGASSCTAHDHQPVTCLLHDCVCCRRWCERCSCQRLVVWVPQLPWCAALAEHYAFHLDPGACQRQNQQKERTQKSAQEHRGCTLAPEQHCTLLFWECRKYVADSWVAMSASSAFDRDKVPAAVCDSE